MAEKLALELQTSTFHSHVLILSVRSLLCFLLSKYIYFIFSFLFLCFFLLLSIVHFSCFFCLLLKSCCFWHLYFLSVLFIFCLNALILVWMETASYLKSFKFAKLFLKNISLKMFDENLKKSN